MLDLKGKRILYLGPPFFGYENDIQKSLIAKGADVDFFNERVFVSSIGKILVRLGVNLLINKAIVNHYNAILKQAKQTPYDFLLVVSPETMSQEFVSKLKGLNPNIKTVLYMWDSIANKKKSDKLLSVFDRTLTFDPQDKTVFPEVEFLPLFFVPEFSAQPNNCVQVQYSVSFIGTVHSDRYKLVKKIVSQFKGESNSAYMFFYCPSKLLFYLKKIFTQEFDGVDVSEVKFSPLSKPEVFDILSLSNIVIDIEHPTQRGLTMRTIEMLGSGRKLVTTNLEVLDYDFYNESNICVVDRRNPVVPKEFLNSAYELIDKKVVANYSLSSWLDNVFK